MKKLLASIVVVGLLAWVTGCAIVDPIIIALNLPLEVCADLNAGSAWNETDTYNIRDEIADISSDYPDKIKATRVADISVYMVNPPTSGSGSGVIAYAFNGGPLDTLATFTNVPFDSLADPGVSLLNTGLITYRPGALTTLLNTMQDSTGLPSLTTVTIHTSGTTTVTVPSGTKMCARIHYQADAEI